MNRCENCCGDFLPGEGYYSEDKGLALCKKCADETMSINDFMGIVEPSMDDLLNAFGFYVVEVEE